MVATYRFSEEYMGTQADYEVNRELGECYLFMGELEKAEMYYRKAALADLGHAAPYLGLATVAVQRGDFASALTLYSQALDIEENDKALAGMGLVKMEMGEHGEAFELFERAAQVNPTNKIALNCLVREGYRLELLDRVLPVLECSLTVDNSQEEVRTTLAGCLMTLGREKEARQHLETVLETNPESPSAKELYAHIVAA